MVLNDDNHEAARIIKDLDKRLSNIEQESRQETIPNFLISTSDSLEASDNFENVREIDLEGGRWNETGWSTSTWGSYD